MLSVRITARHLLVTCVQLLLPAKLFNCSFDCSAKRTRFTPYVATKRPRGLPVISRHVLRCITFEECTKIVLSSRSFSRLRSTDKSTVTRC